MGQLGQASSGSVVNVSQIVANLCGTNPNYCTWKSGANKNGGLEAFLTQAVETCYLPNPATCSVATDIFDADFSCATGQVAVGESAVTKAATVTKAVTGLTAAGAVAAGAAVGSVVPVVGTIIGAIAGLIGSLFGGGHAKAVEGEAQDICNQVPGVNQVLEQIDAGLASGQVTASDAASLYSQLQSQFTSALHQNTTYKTGDTLWAFTLALQGIIQARTALLQAGQLVGGGSIPTGAAASIGASLGIPPLYLALGALALVYFLL